MALVYPATTYAQASELIINDGNLFHEIIDGDGASSVDTGNGDVPTLRKALIDNFYFKFPINWSAGSSSTVFNQLYLFTNGFYYYSPYASTSTSIPMGATPVGDSNWVQYSTSSVVQWTHIASGGETTLSPPYSFASCTLSIDGREQAPVLHYTVTNNTINLGGALYDGEVCVVTLSPMAFQSSALVTSSSALNYSYTTTASESNTIALLPSAVTVALIFVDGVVQTPASYTISSGVVTFDTTLPINTTILVVY